VEDGARHNLTFTRIYPDGEEWKTITSFGRDILLRVAKLAARAHTRIPLQWPEKNPHSADLRRDRMLSATTEARDPEAGSYGP
jgi:hypothetical protein